MIVRMSELAGGLSPPFQSIGRTAALCYIIGVNVYAFYFILRLKRPSARLLALLPVLPPAILVPWYGPTAGERFFYSGVFIWLIGSKLLLVAWNRGPAADPHAVSSFPNFFSALVLSVHLKSENSAPTTENHVVHAEESTGIIKSSRNGRNSEPNGLLRRKSVCNGDQRLPADENIPRSEESESEGRANAEESEESMWRKCWTTVVNSPRAPFVVLRAGFLFVACVTSIRLVLGGKAQIPGPLIYVGYFFSIYFTVSFCFALAGAIPALIFGFQLHPQFDMPFLSTSLREFWGRRWNLVINNLLRVTVYEPILDWEKRRGKKESEASGGTNTRGGEVWNPSKLTRGLGVFACFLVSGLMHEMLFIYIKQEWPTFEVTAFFVIHGVGVILEMIVIKSEFWKKSGLSSAPVVLGWAYTVAVVWATSAWLFFPPIERAGRLDAVLLDFQRFFLGVSRRVSSAFEGNSVALWK